MKSSTSLLLICAALAQASFAAEKLPGPVLDGLGDLHHPVTTESKQAQRYFDQGLMLAYAFNHAEAVRSFREAARLDPECAMAWWGVALAYGPNINKPMDPADAPKAWEALAKARELAPGASLRALASASHALGASAGSIGLLMFGP